MTPTIRSSILLVGATAVLAACSAQPDAKAVPVVDSTHAANGDVASKTAAAATPSATTPATTPAAPVGVTGAAIPANVPEDTAHIRLNPGRNAHDSSSYASAIRAGARKAPTWPTGPAPLAGAILPAKRVVAFYGNPLSKKMGVLGEYPVDQMLAKLDQTVAEWRKADPSTPVQPALHLIAVVAQGAPGRDGMYRLRMDTTLINKVYGWAQQKNALLFLDIQVGKSTLQQELPRLLPFLARPNVHLAIDAEFSMHYDREGMPPGKKVGQFDAADVNYAAAQLEKLVSDNKLPPKMLIVHRWTRKMISNASQIKLDPRVQIVMDMDGWGPPWLKFDSYRDYEVAEPVQFTGFKIFFHNDVKHGDALLTASEVLKLRPKPMYIQYQ
ncbi:MAG: hypothetical protein JWM41_824 [Gemmatimonadetes bacterium]|nr:hypothetical protein [Gemmatimonadota bacterium]